MIFLCLWTIAAHTDSVSLPVLQLLHSQHRRRSSWPPCFSCTAEPSRGSLAPPGLDPIDTWPVASTYSSCGSLEFCLAFPLHAPCVPCLIFGTGWVFPRILSVLFCFMSCVSLLGFLILQCLSVAIVISCHIVLGDVLLLILLITTTLPKMMADVESDDND